MLLFFLGTECSIDNVLEQNKKRMNKIHMTYFSIQSFISIITSCIALKWPILTASYNKTDLFFGKCEKMNVSDKKQKKII